MHFVKKQIVKNRNRSSVASLEHGKDDCEKHPNTKHENDRGDYKVARSFTLERLSYIACLFACVCITLILTVSPPIWSAHYDDKIQNAKNHSNVTSILQNVISTSVPTSNLMIDEHKQNDTMDYFDIKLSNHDFVFWNYSNQFMSFLQSEHNILRKNDFQMYDIYNQWFYKGKINNYSVYSTNVVVNFLNKIVFSNDFDRFSHRYYLYNLKLNKHYFQFLTNFTNFFEEMSKNNINIVDKITTDNCWIFERFDNNVNISLFREHIDSISSDYYVNTKRNEPQLLKAQKVVCVEIDNTDHDDMAFTNHSDRWITYDPLENKTHLLNAKPLIFNKTKITYLNNATAKFFALNWTSFYIYLDTNTESLPGNNVVQGYSLLTGLWKKLYHKIGYYQTEIMYNGFPVYSKNERSFLYKSMTLVNNPFCWQMRCEKLHTHPTLDEPGRHLCISKKTIANNVYNQFWTLGDGDIAKNANIRKFKFYIEEEQIIKKCFLEKDNYDNVASNIIGKNHAFFIWGDIRASKFDLKKVDNSWLTKQIGYYFHSSKKEPFTIKKHRTTYSLSYLQLFGPWVVSHPTYKWQSYKNKWNGKFLHNPFEVGWSFDMRKFIIGNNLNSSFLIDQCIRDYDHYLSVYQYNITKNCWAIARSAHEMGRQPSETSSGLLLCLTIVNNQTQFVVYNNVITHLSWEMEKPAKANKLMARNPQMTIIENFSLNKFNILNCSKALMVTSTSPEYQKYNIRCIDSSYTIVRSFPDKGPSEFELSINNTYNFRCHNKNKETYISDIALSTNNSEKLEVSSWTRNIYDISTDYANVNCDECTLFRADVIHDQRMQIFRKYYNDDERWNCTQQNRSINTSAITFNWDLMCNVFYDDKFEAKNRQRWDQNSQCNLKVRSRQRTGRHVGRTTD